MQFETVCHACNVRHLHVPSIGGGRNDRDDVGERVLNIPYTFAARGKKWDYGLMPCHYIQATDWRRRGSIVESEILGR